MCDAVCKNVAKPKMFINSEMSNSDHSLNHSFFNNNANRFCNKKNKRQLYHVSKKSVDCSQYTPHY